MKGCYVATKVIVLLAGAYTQSNYIHIEGAGSTIHIDSSGRWLNLVLLNEGSQHTQI